MYRDALAQTRGKATVNPALIPVDLAVDDQMSLAIDMLAMLDGETRAAQLLALTAERVREERQRAREIHIHIWVWLRCRDAGDGVAWGLPEV